MSDLSQVLIDAQSSVLSAQRNAEAVLLSRKQHDPVKMAIDLSLELANDSNHTAVRQLAALYLKNIVINANHEEFLVDFWLKVDPATAVNIRNAALAALATQDRDARNSAAQVVSAFAKIDLPNGRWPEILGLLVQNATNTVPNIKLASLMTLGYICEELPPNCVDKAQSDAILTAIAASLTPEETHPEIKLNAINALKNSLPFTRSNFAVQHERAIIVSLVCQCCQFSELKVRMTAFQTLCEMVSLYYEYLDQHLNELGNVTYIAIQQDDPRVAVLAIEFWNCVADIERDKLETRNTIKNFTVTAAGSLVPLLLANISKFEEFDEEWNLHRACGSTLQAVALVTGDSQVDACYNFILGNASQHDWKLKNCAALVIGSILEGPSSHKINPLLTNFLNILTTLLQDHKSIVRQTASWSLGRFCEIIPKFILHPSSLSVVVPCIMAGLDDEPKAAGHMCWALINLYDSGHDSNFLNREHFSHLIQKLIATAARPDAHESDTQLQVAAFSALSTMIEKAEDSNLGNIQDLIMQLLLMFEASIQAGNENSQIFICSALQSALGRARSQSLSDTLVERMMVDIEALFKARNNVVEEAVQATGTLAQTIESRFEPYMQRFGPYLVFALRKQDIASVCKAGTMCVGDLARAIGDRISLYLGDLVPALLSNLESSSMDAEVKVQSIGSLADLVCNARGAFVTYIPSVLSFITSAAQASSQPIDDTKDPDMAEYMIRLREVIMQFYVSCLQGLNEAGQADVILNEFPQIVNYAMHITQETFKPSQDLHLSSCGVIGDGVVAYKGRVKQFVTGPQVVGYLNRQASSPAQRVREVAMWAIKIVTGLN